MKWFRLILVFILVFIFIIEGESTVAFELIEFFSNKNLFIFKDEIEVAAIHSNDHQVISGVKTANSAIKAINVAVKLYSKVLDHIVPWRAFNDTLSEFDKFKEEYSEESAQLINEIKALMKHGIDAYHHASEFIFRWSDEAMPLLNTYIELFDEHTVEKAHLQKELLVQMLTKGVAQMNSAQNAIEESSISFNIATGKLVTLNTRFMVEFDEKSDYFQSQIESMRRIYRRKFGILAATIGYVLIRWKFIPELKDKIFEIETYYEHLESKVNQTFRDIDNIKRILYMEIQEIGNLKMKTKETETYMDLDNAPQLRDTLVHSAQDLIADCNEYSRKHGGIANR